MPTAKDIAAEVQRLRDDIVETQGSADAAAKLDAYFLPTKSWGLVTRDAADPNRYELVYTLGDTKGEALNRLLALRQGVWLGRRLRE